MRGLWRMSGWVSSQSAVANSGFGGISRFRPGRVSPMKQGSAPTPIPASMASAMPSTAEVLSAMRSGATLSLT